jgi:hypothetical protein
VREEQRAAAVAERRAAFQRETLLALQNAIADYARASARLYLTDLMAYRSTGKWGQTTEEATAFREDFDLRAAEARGELNKHQSRVEDEDVWQMVETITSASHEASAAGSHKDAEAAIRRMAEAVFPAHQRIGELLRSLY